VRISVFGLGYVGAVSLACLARDGHHGVGVDVDPYKLELIRSGHSPIVEEGIQELMKQVVGSGRVTVTNDVAKAIGETELSFVRGNALEPQRWARSERDQTRDGADWRRACAEEWPSYRCAAFDGATGHD
jgi:GDP-mannose 6-dehydrogenase